MSPPAREERLARIRTQRLAQLGTLLAGFAHEIRNPLSTIGLNLQLVLEEFRDPEGARDKRTQKRLVTVEAEVRRLQKILEEFLSFARAPEPKLGPVDLNILGLDVELDDCDGGPVTVDISAEAGPGNLLGNLLTGLLGILDTPANGNAIINAIGRVAREIRNLLGLLG